MRFRVSIFGEIVRMALNSILAHKLRTFLTLLGIIIGVASVMVVGAGLSGAQQYVTTSVSNALGSESFIVTQFTRFGHVSDEEMKEMIRRNRKIERDDYEFVRRRCPDCFQLTAQVSGNTSSYYRAQELKATSVNGVTANTVLLGDFEVAEGRFFTVNEERNARFVCVIGSDLVDTFFPAVDPIGRKIRLGNFRLEVIGVLEKKGSSFGQTQDNVVYLPLRTYQKMYGTRRSLNLQGKARSREKFDSAIDQLRVAMRVRHRLRPGDEDDFGIISTDQINQMVDQFTGAVAVVVVPITLISLLVGGIVIMNIMLVSVTERTFEIGIRKALGARRRDILYQFLIESFVVSALGGLIGLAIAMLLAWGVESNTDFPMAITWDYVFLSIGVSGSIGLVFGIYPAFQASRLDPITAMTEGK